MTVDPDPLSERTNEATEGDLMMNDLESLRQQADIDPKLAKQFDL